MSVDPNTAYGPSRAGVPVQIDKQTLSAVTSYTSPTWATGAYQKIIIEVSGSVSGGAAANTFMTFQFNADSSLVYAHRGTDNTTALSASNSEVATLGFAHVGAYNNSSASSFSAIVEFNPLTNGYGRLGRSRSGAFWASGAAGGSHSFVCEFLWQDTTTAVTFCTLGCLSGAAFTGRIVTWGVSS